ncbi:LamG domain-containing protein [Candidatus Woesearchaeota archaeon]|nr:LamG domain-containing protein [Candidatus Woesearchaeota archaeon]
MKKRGQSAMEFLMTYGWAIIAVLVVLSALYFLGIFSPKTVSSCSVEAPFVCKDFLSSDTEVVYSIGATGIDTAQVTDIIINGDSCVGLGGTVNNADLSSGEVTSVSCTGINPPLNVDQKISSEILISYTKESGLGHDIKGSGSGITEFSLSHPPNMPSNPSPADDLDLVPIDINLGWTGGDPDGSVSYDVFLKKVSDVNWELKCDNIEVESCDLTPDLDNEEFYQWYVIADDGENQVQNDPWDFTTAPELDLDTELIVFSRLDDGDGATTFDDASPNNNDGTCSGGNCPTWNPSGKLSGAYDFDGSDDYISYGNILQIGTYDFTFSMWINADEYGDSTINTDSIFGKFQSSSYRYHLALQDNGILKFYVSYNADANLVGATSNAGVIPLDGNWHHVVVVGDRDVSTKIYVDGSDVTSTELHSTNSISNTGGFYLGSRTSSIQRFNGDIDEFRFWRRAFTSQEVGLLYNTYS